MRIATCDLSFTALGFALTPSANPGLCRGFFSSRGAEKMAASALPILCRHRPSAADSFQYAQLGLCASSRTTHVASELQLASSWDRQAPAWALRVCRHRVIWFQGFALTPSADPGFCRGFFSSRSAEKMAGSATPIVSRHRPSAADAFFFRASPYGLAAYPGFCRGFFSSRGAEKMAASAKPILCRHRPSAADAFQYERVDFAGVQIRTPNAERRTPNAERRTPNAERRTPNAERRTPNVERRTSNA
jgi:hypothetical protein